MEIEFCSVERHSWKHGLYFFHIKSASCSTNCLSTIPVVEICIKQRFLWLHYSHSHAVTELMTPLWRILVTLFKRSLWCSQVTTEETEEWRRTERLCPGKRLWVANKLQDTTTWKKYTNKTCTDLVSLSSLIPFLLSPVLLLYGQKLCQVSITSWIADFWSENWTGFMPSITTPMQSTVWNAPCLHKIRCKKCYLIAPVLLCKIPTNEWRGDSIAILPIIKRS